MILPFFPGFSESSTAVNFRTDEFGFTQDKSSGKIFETPFAGFLRDQSAASSGFKNLPLTSPTADQNGLLDLEVLTSNPNLPVDVAPHPYLGKFLEAEGLQINQQEDNIPIPPPSLEGEGGNALGNADVQREHTVPWSVTFSHEGQRPAILASQIVVAGGLGGEQSHSGLPVPESFFMKHPWDKNILQTGDNLNRHQIVSDIVNGHSSIAGSSNNKAPTGSVVDVAKNATHVQDADKLLSPHSSPPAGMVQKPPKPLLNEAFQVPLPFEDPPATLAEVVQSNQSRLKYVNGLLSFLSPASDSGKGFSITMPADPLRDSSLSVTGDRSKDVLDAIGKSLGVDQQSGQGINNGAGGSTNSHPGFQQSSSLSPGSGMRMAEERVPDFPSPALQRLQMDVQISETNRIQIDVGVQHRQVYAGLLVDQAALKHLAVQFVPQLEDRLAQNDMELQEFSAEIRDQLHDEQESERDSRLPEMSDGRRGSPKLSHAPELHSHFVKRVEEHGLHLVA